MSQTALITGASSGIGKALANQFAENNFDLVVVAEKADELSRAAQELRNQHEVEVTEYPKDLMEENAPADVYNWTREQDIQINILVNNAGVGEREKFHESDLEKDIRIIRLNIEAVVRLTKLYVRDMVARGDGKILNVGSVAGFQPGPLLAVYHASKAFVVSFSEAICDELQDTGVSVTTLCPGPTDTNFFNRADMENARILEDGIVMEPEKVARAGYKALMNGERVIVPGMSNKMLTFTRRLIPESLQASINKKFYEVKEKEE